MKLRYVLCENGGVEADLPATDGLEGYPGILHGGIIATLLDGAMTQCLFAMGVEAVTADLHVRFRHPIHTDRPLRVLARLAEDRGGWYLLEAEAVQDDRIAALAKGTFMRSFRDH